ncbi:uncharacterized protein VNE69_03378 [Vairimorpha necatrix]|uniref:Uncharacterized protein n=1 Tax=Vairimorpha necatrix TaxID=6039 RepID=A0AAX4JB09_9MICR
MKKIEDRDYVSINHCKSYNSISIYKSMDEYGNDNGLVEVSVSCDIKNNNVKIFTVNCKNKSLNEIITEIENKIRGVLGFPNNKLYVLFYSEYQFRDSIGLDNSITMKNIVETIKKINRERKINKKGWEIYYENICLESGYLEEIFFKTSKNNVNTEYTIKYYDYVPNYFLFHINVENNSYLFKFSIEEIDYLNDIEIKLENKYNEKILKKILELYNLSYEYLFEIDTYVVPINRIPNGIEIKYGSKFLIIEVFTNKVVFRQNSGEYHYVLQNDNINYIIDEQCLLEFKRFIEIASRINDENISKGIDIFNRILYYEDETELMIEIVLDTPGSALNIIIAHTLLYYNMIDELELIIIISNEEYDETRKTEIIKMIMSRVLKSNFTEFIITKIFLLLATEKYIIENEVEDELFYKNFKLIGNLIRKKNTRDKIEMCNIKDSFNLLGIMEEIGNVHIANFKKYKGVVVTSICKIISMFIGFNTIVYDFFENKQHAKYEFNEVIASFGLKNDDVDECNKIIRNKLLENNQQEKKFEEKRKTKEAELIKIIQILQEVSLENDINKIKLVALNGDIIKLFDKDLINEFATKLINGGINLIRKIFEEKVTSEDITVFSINEYKEYLEENLIKEIKINIKKNIKINSEIALPKTLIELFDNEIKISRLFIINYERK